MNWPLVLDTLPVAVPALGDITFYDNEVPQFVERQLELLYQCVMTTIARFEIWQAAPGASTYVARANGAICALLLFRREGRRVTVYNQQVSLPGRELARFAQAVLSRYPEVSLVSFYAIDTDAASVPYPLQRHACLETIALALPASPKAYLASLGGNMRTSIKRYHNKVVRDFPSFRFEVVHGAAAAQWVPQIVAFNHARISAKNQVCYHNAEGTERLARLVARYGVVGVASIDGQVCAGIICARIADTWHMMVVAHDPKYDAWRLGKLCCYLSVCDAIEQGGKVYHFGWGRFDYKYKMLGRHQDLYRVEIYRSRLHMVLHARHALQTVGVAAVRRLRLRVAAARSGQRFSDRCIDRAAGLVRAAKRLLRRVRAGH